MTEIKKDIKKRTGNVLNENGNRLILILAILIILVFLLIPYILGKTVDFLTVLFPLFRMGQAVLAALQTLVILCTLFFVMIPLLLGLFRIALGMTLGEEMALSDIFFLFSLPKGESRAFLLRCDLFWRLGILYALFAGGMFASAMLSDSVFLAYAMRILTVALTLGGWILLSCGRFSAIANFLLSTLPCDVGKGVCTRTVSRGEARAFLCSFLGEFLLGTLTVGILWLADLFPRMLISYAHFCTQEEEHNVSRESGTSPCSSI